MPLQVVGRRGAGRGWENQNHAIRVAWGRLAGLDLAAIVDVVLRLTPQDFFESMTSHDDHRIWQDVYRPHSSGGLVYLKPTVVEDVLVVSFKELSP